MDPMHSMVLAMKELVNTMHVALTRVQAQVLELTQARAEMQADVERARADTRRSRADIDRLRAHMTVAQDTLRSQDLRIAELEALESYGWRHPPPYVRGDDAES